MRFYLKYGNSHTSRIISLMVMLLFICAQISAPLSGDDISSAAKPADGHAACHASAACDQNAAHDCEKDGCESGDCGNHCSHCCQHAPMQSLLPADNGSLPAPMLALVIVPVHAILPGNIPAPFLPPRT